MSSHTLLHLFTQDKSEWTVHKSLKGQIETFKRTMPLIQDLKNPAMRERHWEQLKEEVQKPFDHTSKYQMEVLSKYYAVLRCCYVGTL